MIRTRHYLQSHHIAARAIEYKQGDTVRCKGFFYLGYGFFRPLIITITQRMICVGPAQCFHHQRMHTGIIIRGKTSHCFFLFLRIVLIVMQSNRIISRYTSCAANNLIRARPMQEVRYRHKIQTKKNPAGHSFAASHRQS